jgi:hypothetical protein
MNRKHLIDGLLKEGFSNETLSVLNDKQLTILYKKMVNEVNVVVDDPTQLKVVKQQIDPTKDSIEIKKPAQSGEQEMEEGLKNKKPKKKDVKEGDILYPTGHLVSRASQTQGRDPKLSTNPMVPNTFTVGNNSGDIKQTRDEKIGEFKTKTNTISKSNYPNALDGTPTQINQGEKFSRASVALSQAMGFDDNFQPLTPQQEVGEGWDSKLVAKKHKQVNSSYGKLKAAQTRKDDEYIKMDNDDKAAKKRKDKEERKSKREVKESNIGKFHKPVFKDEEKLNSKAKEVLENDWIQKAVKHPGRCTNPGDENCPKGSPQYNLAMRFKKGDIHKDNMKEGKKVGCKCGKCDICNKVKSKKKPIGLSEKNFLSLAKKGDIMEMIQRKLAENTAMPTTAPTKPQTRPETKPHTVPKPKTPFRPAPGPNPRPKAGIDELPSFLSFDAVFGKHPEFAGPATAPAKPATRPTTNPETKPRTVPKPQTPFRPNPGPNPNRKAELDIKHQINEYLDMHDVKQVPGTPYGKVKDKKTEKKNTSDGNKTKKITPKKDGKK